MSSGEQQPLTTPRDDRAAARDGRRNHLEIPTHGLGRADLIRSRSPSPAAANPGAFRFPPAVPQQPEDDQFVDAPTPPNDNMGTPQLSVDDIIKIATASAKAAAQEMAATLRVPAPDADAAVVAAATTSTSANNHIKKVELPSFDKKNIHTWIRRVEAAFGRAGVTTAKDKFFFIESKLDVNVSPRINEFLCGDSTDQTWDNFLSHLQEEYGKTKEQQASQFLRGIPRDNLRPTQHLAKIKDAIKDIELDDLIKEMVLKDLPTSVRQSLAERTNLSSEEAAKAADHHFDKDGRLKHETESSKINSVTTSKVNNANDCPGLVDTEDESDSVNAIGGQRFKGKASRGGFRKSTPQKPFTPAFSDNSRNQTPGNFNRNNTERKTPQQFCRFHAQFGHRAKNCEPGCQFKKQQGIAPAGNGSAGRRT